MLTTVVMNYMYAKFFKNSRLLVLVKIWHVSSGKGFFHFKAKTSMVKALTH